MELKDLKPLARKSRKRVGRGDGSGHGTYSCKGMKGQTARAGGRRRPGFEGGQMPFSQKIPKLKGFKNHCKTGYQVINLKDLNSFEQGSKIDALILAKKGLISDISKPIKLLADGVLETKDLKINLDKISNKAKASLEKNNCEFVEII